MSAGWESLERPGPDSVEVGDDWVTAGSRVRLWPRGSGDVFDLALTGRDARDTPSLRARSALQPELADGAMEPHQLLWRE